ncbi:ERI1 exoribonuclease 2-like isoform X1 [Punica granatum]|uniref:ERI1 exoribonuclease 2-like isoform X1 n=1 Tax=Punica granatum TaxID=22663 RepID=A0A6P8CVN5_PUNGR|nr:ERI1 exoribonuclease 2-like isoform X1 [Punica granatum]
MALDLRENMQMNFEASFNCLKGNGFPANYQYYGNSIEGMPGLKDGTGNWSDGNATESGSPLIGKPFETLPEFHGKPLHQHDYSAFYPSYHKVEQAHANSFGTQSYPFHTETGFQYIPYIMYAKGYPSNYHFQDFQYFVVIDFEATCDKGKNPHPQEIIEFPSVIVSSMTGQLEACFQTYVRPTCNQVLSDFCKDLTGIQQIQVDRGVTLSEALLRHDKWLEKKGIKSTKFVVVTWSNWDCRVMLESECRYKKIRKPPYFNQWINLKVPFHEVFGGVRCNLKEAVEMAGLTWQGRAHCGLDDAKNTARLLSVLMHKGIRFSITNSIMWRETEHLPSWKYSLSLKQTLHSSHQVLSYRDPQYHPCCFCGVRSSRGLIRKPGLKEGSFFFGCGKWTAARGACCHYFQWAS